MVILFISRVTIWSVFQNLFTFSSGHVKGSAWQYSKQDYVIVKSTQRSLNPASTYIWLSKYFCSVYYSYFRSAFILLKFRSVKCTPPILCDYMVDFCRPGHIYTTHNSDRIH